MVVHIGVVLIAVAFAASHSYAHAASFNLTPGQSVTYRGHTFKYLGLRTVNNSQRSAIEASVQVDGGKIYRPAVSTYPLADDETVGTPSVASTLLHDVYLTLPAVPSTTTGAATIGVLIEPLVSWVWIGGGVMVVGTVLAAWPGKRRRRPTDPVSAPIAGIAPPRRAVTDAGDDSAVGVGAGT